MTDKLYGNDIITQTFDSLCASLEGREIELPRKARAIISDDSDHHRTREGYVKYRSAHLVEVNGLPWALLHGNGHGPYGQGEYQDILAIDLRPIEPTDSAILDAVVDEARSNSWFRHSFCWGDSDGGIKTVSIDYGRSYRPRLARRIVDTARSHELSVPTISPGGMFFSLRSGAYTYDKKLVPALTQLLSQYLRMPFEQ